MSFMWVLKSSMFVVWKHSPLYSVTSKKVSSSSVSLISCVNLIVGCTSLVYFFHVASFQNLVYSSCLNETHIQTLLMMT